VPPARRASLSTALQTSILANGLSCSNNLELGHSICNGLILLGMFRLAVAGAHTSQLPLNSQLTGLGAQLVGPARTAAKHRMFDLGPKPSLIRQAEGEPGFAFETELWDIPTESVGSFITCAAPPPTSQLPAAHVYAAVRVFHPISD
jgi:hypothetical protein